MTSVLDKTLIHRVPRVMQGFRILCSTSISISGSTSYIIYSHIEGCRHHGRDHGGNNSNIGLMRVAIQFSKTSNVLLVITQNDNSDNGVKIKKKRAPVIQTLIFVTIIRRIVYQE